MAEIDQRHYQFALDSANKKSTKERIGIIVGGLVAISGMSIAGYLGAHGHDVMASMIALPLATIIAMILGRKAL